MILYSAEALAQDPKGDYHNMEKYWWYRYRLVNDFLKIGPNCGESIPAQRRSWVAELDSPGVHKKGVLSFDDATIDLGNYISMLATEYKLLKNNNFNTTRTRMELYYALNAFERIDRNAEAYCNNIFNTYPCNPGNTDGWNNKLNGFFIRDDVPGNFSDGANYLHFNRKGIRRLNPTNHWIDAGAIISRLPPSTPSWPHYVKQMPWEESKDQVVQMAMGLSLTAKLVSEDYVPGDNLKWKGLMNLDRMIGFIPTGFYGTKTHWNIINPITDECVYGIFPKTPSCLNGGAMFWDLSSGAAAGLVRVGGNPAILHTVPTLAAWTWQLLQNLTKHKDLGFWGTFGALADNWIGPRGGRQTFHKLTKIAEAYDGGNQHLPYLYRVLHPGKGEWYNIAETRKLLDAAPPCGIHNYKGVWSIVANPGGGLTINPPNSHHWSGNDLIHEHYKRNKKDVSSDCNGLDYMTLFNLYSLQDPNYIKYMFNSYYRENYDQIFPLWYPPAAKFIGTHDMKLKLNFLEYLSTKSIVAGNANLTLRGAKTIDLIPGFEVRYGGSLLVYIEDYEISCGDIRRPGQDSYAGSAYHYAEVRGDKNNWIPAGRSNRQQQGNNDTTIVLDDSPDGTPYTPDESASVDGDMEEVLTCAEERAYFDSLVAQIRAAGDPDEIAYLDTVIIPNTYFPACDTITNNNRNFVNRQTGETAAEDAFFQVFPNPNKGNFTLVFSAIGDYEISLYDPIGKNVYREKVADRGSAVIQGDDLQPGIYTAIVVDSNKKRHVQKVVITR